MHALGDRRASRTELHQAHAGEAHPLGSGGAGAVLLVVGVAVVVPALDIADVQVRLVARILVIACPPRAHTPVPCS
eukprot:COSAG01_NODE_4292_length_5167_cov_2.551500_2_plen_76_part_00